jgi:hypothetical protein
MTYSEKDLIRALGLELIRKSDMGWGYENVARLIADVRRETLEEAAQLAGVYSMSAAKAIREILGGAALLDR